MTSHANRGVALEHVLDTVHARYHRQGAYVQRNPTPYKVLGAIAGGLRVVPEADAPPDYLVVAHGLSLLADAKSWTTARWKLDQVKRHQAAAFTRWEGQSELHRAGIILWMRGEPRSDDCWWLPWSKLEPLWTHHHDGHAVRGDASLTVPVIRSIGTSVRHWDWLPAAVAAATPVRPA